MASAVAALSASPGKYKPEGHSAKKTKSSRAGLLFPVGRVSRKLRRGRFAPRVGGGAAIYLTAVLEYLTAEVLSLSGSAAYENRCRRITPRYMELAVRNDAALNELLRHADWMQSGVIPHIEPALLPKKKRHSKASSPSLFL